MSSIKKIFCFVSNHISRDQINCEVFYVFMTLDKPSKLQDVGGKKLK